MSKPKHYPSRMMTVIEIRRMFIKEVEDFIDEEFTGMLHATISLADADTLFAEFIGLKRAAEERTIKKPSHE